MILRIRNMESDRCRTIVKQELTKLGLPYRSVELGEVDLIENPSELKLQMFETAMKESGLELMPDTKSLIVGKIKAAVNQFVYSPDDLNKPDLPDYISKNVNYDYNFISKIFSDTEGITIEKYLIRQRIKRVKELLLDKSLSISDITYKMFYSSVAHLSNQFKKVTGLTPFQYKELREKKCKKSANL